MTSVAFADLGTRLDEVRVLAAEDPVRADKHTTKVSLSSAINRACVVLLSAHLEGFLEDLATEGLDALVLHQAEVDNLPILLRSIHAEEHIRVIESMKDRKSRAPRIEKLFSEEALMWTAGTTLVSTMVRRSTVCGEMDNPGSNEIRKFLELLGVDINQHLEMQGASVLLGQINGLVSRRNAIAHGEVSGSITPGDVDDYILTIEDFGREADAAVAQSIQAICKAAVLPW